MKRRTWLTTLSVVLTAVLALACFFLAPWDSNDQEALTNSETLQDGTEAAVQRNSAKPEVLEDPARSPRPDVAAAPIETELGQKSFLARLRMLDGSPLRGRSARVAVMIPASAAFTRRDSSSSTSESTQIVPIAADDSLRFSSAVELLAPNEERTVVFKLLGSDNSEIAEGSATVPIVNAVQEIDLGRIELTEIQKKVEVRAQILTRAGRPKAKATIEVLERCEEADDRQLPVIRVIADEEGRVVLALRPWDASLGGSRFLEFKAQGRASIRLPASASAGEVHDLGSVHLTEERLIARGKVVDSDNKGVPHVLIQVFTRSDGDWKKNVSIQGGSNEEGLFEVLSDAEGDVFRLQPFKWGYVGDLSPEIRRGTTDMCLSVVQGGHIAGRVEAGPGIPANCVSIKVEAKPLPLFLRPGPDGEFRSPYEVPEGVYEVTCLVPGQEPILFKDVMVRSREETRDPRLNPIDLRGKLGRLSIRALDESGRPIPDETMTLLSRNTERISRIKTDADGVAVFAVPQGFTELSVEGMRRSRVPVQWPEPELQVVAFRKLQRVSVHVVGQNSDSMSPPLSVVLRSPEHASFAGTISLGRGVAWAEAGQDYEVALCYPFMDVPFEGLKRVSIPAESSETSISLIVDPQVLEECRLESLQAASSGRSN